MVRLSVGGMNNDGTTFTDHGLHKIVFDEETVDADSRYLGVNSRRKQKKLYVRTQHEAVNDQLKQFTTYMKMNRDGNDHGEA